MGTVHNMNAGLASDLSLNAAAADNAFLAISTERGKGVGEAVNKIFGTLLHSHLVSFFWMLSRTSLSE